jgi:hypothetical protein
MTSDTYAIFDFDILNLIIIDTFIANLNCINNDYHFFEDFVL